MSRWLSPSRSSVGDSESNQQEKVSYVVDPMEGDEITPELGRLLDKIRENVNAEKFYLDVGETVLAIKEPEGMFRNKTMMSKREHLLKRAGNIWKQRFQELASQEDDVHQLLSTPKAHPFSKVNKALKVLRETGKSQVLLTKGISGSGKSIISELLIQQLLLVADKKGDFSDNVSHASLLLNTFGNAQTSSNPNSTRMAKLCEVRLDKQLQVAAVSFQTALLEKSRLACVPFHERNFHIFHQMCEGLTKVDGGAWKSFANKIGVAREPNDFLYLRPEKFEPITASPREWNGVGELQKTIESFVALEFSREDIESIFQTLAIILYFGNIKMKQRKSGEGCIVDVKNELTLEALKMLSVLLNIDEKELEHSLVYSFATAAKGEKIKTTIRRQLAVYALDAFSKGLYDMLLIWIVGKINTVLESFANLDQRLGCVSVLDMFGFQRDFQVSGFETLLVNYANETIQAEFLNAALYANMAHCFDEGFTPPGSELKKNQQVIHLFNKKKKGIMKLLNGSTVFDPSETKYREYSMIDQRFLESLKKKVDNDYVRALPSRPECFLVKHFLGDVVYTARGMVGRNHDLVNTGIMSMIHTAPQAFEFVRRLINSCAEISTVHEPEANRKSYVVMYRKAQTISKSSGNVLLHDSSLAFDGGSGGSGGLGAGSGNGDPFAPKFEELNAASDDVNVDVVASHQQKKLKKTIATQFEEQLHSIIIGEWIGQKGVHFITCVSPFVGQEYQKEYLAPQLQFSGITAIQEIEDKLYPESFTIQEFIESFGFLVENLSLGTSEPALVYKLIMGKIDSEIDQERSYKRYQQHYNTVRVRGSLLKLLTEMRDGPAPPVEEEAMADEQEETVAENSVKRQVSFNDNLQANNSASVGTTPKVSPMKRSPLNRSPLNRSPTKPAPELPEPGPVPALPEPKQLSKEETPITLIDAKHLLSEVVDTIKSYVAESTPKLAPAPPAGMGKEDADALKLVLEGILNEMKTPSEQTEHSHHFYYHSENDGNESARPNQALLGNGDEENDPNAHLDKVCCAIVCCQDGIGSCCCGPRKRARGQRRGTCFALICCDSVKKSVHSKPKGGYDCFSMNYFCNPFYICQLWSKDKEE